MVDIRPFSSEYDDYRRDESRSQGHADSISFPAGEDEVREALALLRPGRVPVTVQGGRTGLAAGAVPDGGHVMSLGRMTRFLGMRRDDDGIFHLLVEPGVVLSELRKGLAGRSIPTAGWDEASLVAWGELCAGPEQFFPTDPTEASATLGGMVACNASGARSYRYGPVRPHVSALRVVLADGDVLDLRRGEQVARGRTLGLVTVGGRRITLDLPTYRMPESKSASGYYADDGMDAVDVFVGSDGTLGVITQIELALMPSPPVVWGVSCFFGDEGRALDFVDAVRPGLSLAAAIEYLDGGALAILRRQRAAGATFATLPEVPGGAGCCVYVELDCEDGGQALRELYLLGDLLREAGGDEGDTWVARTEADREAQLSFRHAVPESVNMLVDERRRDHPAITKLGSDMSVPDDRLHDVVALYRTTLAESGLESAAWGHVGNNHLHVNVLPRDEADYARGRELFAGWARAVAGMGGAVSAEHGVGKLKRDFLLTMYGERHVREMARMKHEIDPAGIFGRGNLFPADTPWGADAVAREEA